MHPSVKRLLCTLAAFALLSGSALAGPLLDDPGTPVMSGSETFNGIFGQVNAVVEYAVFAPGDFGSYAPLGSPAAADPSGGTEYVYTYEIFNNAVFDISALSVSLQPGVVGVDPAIPDTLSIAGGLEPDSTEFIPVGNPKANIKWSYVTTSFGIGQHSDILLFTSTFEPDLFNAAMAAGIDVANGSLASPSLTAMPEPSTFVMAAMAAIGFLAAGYIRKRKG